MPEHSTRRARDAAGRDTAARPRATDRGAVPVLWLVLLATPTAAGANTVVLTLPDIAAAFDATVATPARLGPLFAGGQAVGPPPVAGLRRPRGLG
ncbi:MFS transporter, partial [Streptomyces sp. NPDC059578]